MAKVNTVERFAVMRHGNVKRVVKDWMYYSIFNFCRENGETRQRSDEIAKWARDQAKAGEKYETSGYSITLEEREVAG